MTNKKAKTAQIYAYETVRDRILQGKYEGQTKLIEDKLAKELQISRTPVREAIRRLEQEGLIKKINVLSNLLQQIFAICLKCVSLLRVMLLQKLRNS